MIRKISIDQLLPGMYVVDLHKRWLDHSIWQSRFKVRDEAHIWKLREEGIGQLSIDTTSVADGRHQSSGATLAVDGRDQGRDSPYRVTGRGAAAGDAIAQ